MRVDIGIIRPDTDLSAAIAAALRDPGGAEAVDVEGQGLRGVDVEGQVNIIEGH